MDYGYPGSIPGPPEEALSILYRDRGCQANRTSFPQPPSSLPRLPLKFQEQVFQIVSIKFTRIVEPAEDRAVDQMRQ